MSIKTKMADMMMLGKKEVISMAAIILKPVMVNFGNLISMILNSRFLQHISMVE